MKEKEIETQVINALHDKEVLEAVPGLSPTTLQKYRQHLQKKKILKIREPLIEDRDIPILKEIVDMKKMNSNLFYSTIIEITAKKRLLQHNLLNEIFKDTPESLMHDEFIKTCKNKNIGEDAIDNFWKNINAIVDFLNIFEYDDVVKNFNSTTDIIIAAIVGYNSVSSKEK